MCDLRSLEYSEPGMSVQFARGGQMEVQSKSNTYRRLFGAIAPCNSRGDFCNLDEQRIKQNGVIFDELQQDFWEGSLTRVSFAKFGILMNFSNNCRGPQ
jgi:hypothetical protein